MTTWDGDLVAPGQRRAPAAVSAALLVVSIALLAAGPTYLPHGALSRPLWLMLLVGLHLLTLVVLIGQYRAGATVRLLPIVLGVSWSALTLAALLLLLPDVFAPGPLLGDLDQAPWLWSLRHLALPAYVVALLPWRREVEERLSGRGRTRRLLLAQLVVVPVVAVMVWVVVADPLGLPDIAARSNPAGPEGLVRVVAGLALVVLMIALWAAYVRREVHGVEAWALVAVVAGAGDAVLTAVAVDDQSLAWYGARVLGLVGALSILTALLAEVDRWQTRTREYAAQLEEQNAALTEAQGLRDHLVAVVSHEMRSPLAGLQGYLEVLVEDDEVTDDERRRMHTRSRQLTRRLIMLTEDLLASATQQGLQVLPEPLDLRRQLDDCVAAFPELDVVVSCPPDLQVLADPLRVQQVLANLVRNAQKHGAEPVRVEAAVVAGTTMAEIAVSDAGPGVAADFVPLLFERYTRGPDRNTHGSGLGLWVARTLAERHGGSLHYDPTFQAFVLRLPVVRQRPKAGRSLARKAITPVRDDART